jgi:TolB-like protein
MRTCLLRVRLESSSAGIPTRSRWAQLTIDCAPMGSQTAFGPFLFDRDNFTLSRDGRPQPIGVRSGALLKALLEADGTAVSKLDLTRQAWPGLAVEASNLTVQVAALRKTLGTKTDGQNWIVTVPRLGYRLLRSDSGTRDETGSAGPPALAVLPFVTIGGESAQGYFADGVVEDIITALSRFRSFSVVARNSSFVYRDRSIDVRQVGRELGVRYVLEGSVRRVSDRLRITVQLVEASSGGHIWAEHFDGSVDDVFDMQDRITEKVVGVIGPQIRMAEVARSRRKRPDTLDAYDLYLQALPKVFGKLPEENVNAYQLLSRALELDPAYAPALVHAAFVLEIRHSMGWPALTDDDVPKCLELARRAIASAAGDATVLGLAAIVLVGVGSEYDRGLALAGSALRANPNNHLAITTAAVTHLRCGSLTECIRLAQRAAELSPNDFGAHWPLTTIAMALIMLGKHEDALPWAERSLAANPEFEATYWSLIASNAYLGRMSEAQKYLAMLQAIRPVSAERILRGQDNFRDPRRIEAVVDGMIMAGLPER